MNRPPLEHWEETVQQMGRTLPYPRTPDIAGRITDRLAARPVRPAARRQLAWALVLLLALMAGLLATPSVRAAILEFLQIGSVRIWMVEGGPTASPTLRPPPHVEGDGAPSPLGSVLGLAGETTLTQAAAEAGFQIRLPTYPNNLGPPDAVFYQELGGPVVVLVWLDPQQRDKARLSLHILGEGAFADKGNPTVVLTTTVAGNEAAWTQGPYLLAYERANSEEFDMRRLVGGNVLVWFEGGLTYRLESNLTLEEAVAVAESLE